MARLHTATLIVFATLIGPIGAAQATRTIRADQSMDELSTIGEKWGDATTFDPVVGTGWLASTPLKLNVGAGAQDYNVCFSQNGFASLFSGACEGDGLTPDSGNEITPGANDNFGASGNLKTGIVEPYFSTDTTQYAATAFTWNFQTQLIFLLVGSNGDFNIEFNYDALPLPPGFGNQIFSFGATNIDKAVPGAPDGLEDICFRSGVATACETVTRTPEPSTWAFLLSGLTILAGMTSLHRRRSDCIA